MKFKKVLKKTMLTIAPLLLVVGIDQASKYWARSLVEPVTFWIFQCKLMFNEGILLGYFSELPLNIKEVVLTTLGTFIVVLYFLGLWLLPIRSRATFLGLSILVGGIIGNVADRFNGFAVVDFLTVAVPDKNLPYANFADVFQWLGYVLISIGLYRDSLYYWPKNDWRNKFIINPNFQIRSSLLVALLTFSSAVTVLVFSYAFLKNNHDQMTLKYFFYIGFFVASTFSLVTFIISLALTHRVAGPVFAIQRHIKKLSGGQMVQFKLREFDEFKEVEKDMNQLTEDFLQISNVCPPPLPAELTEKKKAA